MNGWFKINYLRKRVARTDATRSSLKCTESNGPYSYNTLELNLCFTDAL
jgi:hypothetical protein